MEDWIRVREVGSRFEADMARARLEAADIPSVIMGHEAGIFGAGFQGMIPSGVEIRVPRELVAAAEDVLRDAGEGESHDEQDR